MIDCSLVVVQPVSPYGKQLSRNSFGVETRFWRAYPTVKKRRFRYPNTGGWYFLYCIVLYRMNISYALSKHIVLTITLWLLWSRLHNLTSCYICATKINTKTNSDKSTAEIRKQHGFENYLMVPSEGKMWLAAKYGPIVVINGSKYQCDAILIEQHQIRSLALPNLNSKEIKKEARRDYLRSFKVQGWPLDIAISPILDTLGFIQVPSSDYLFSYIHGGLLQALWTNSVSIQLDPIPTVRAKQCSGFFQHEDKLWRLPTSRIFKWPWR